ncbi:hypothetical protein [Rufibacter radiotolerans]|uniref:hypothetical protein n=1 Tax=Rufibacter radiotolerans TaxID=1379910 RepID=UPI0018CF3BD9|nr:hypothetical protein [Rufibacter radiotolerans]
MKLFGKSRSKELRTTEKTRPLGTGKRVAKIKHYQWSFFALLFLKGYVLAKVFSETLTCKQLVRRKSIP